MKYAEAKEWAHVRSAIRRTSKPLIKYWKNHPVPFDNRVPAEDQLADDWEEYDPRDHAECSAYNELPA
ncbi:hypothetical protein [Stutzerimonas nitrititolerans]|uniref:hypothetical protein n=1 Tax=Stutzerimonas nitrititolerans TaxID=2482751 RepID=UPI0028AA1DD5|nr:hypothetical protein [Stutzerimonas nitrititolerans]